MRTRCRDDIGACPFRFSAPIEQNCMMLGGYISVVTLSNPAGALALPREHNGVDRPYRASERGTVGPRA